VGDGNGSLVVQWSDDTHINH